MPHAIADIVAEARLAGRALIEFGQHLLNPTVRLGVTGLSRSGKTVFITALVHGLMQGGRFPVFEPLATGRIARARLAPQPDDAVPRFDYEGNLRALLEERRWPESTDRISELRLLVDYQSRRGVARTLTIDIVDYPGEWLLDLPLLGKSYQQWSAESLELSAHGPRAQIAAPWRDYLATLDPLGPEDEQAALRAAALFTRYLKACRDERYAMSLLPPGRFLMPGDLAGSPALTFSPLHWPHQESQQASEHASQPNPSPAGSLAAMMRRRFEAYKDVVVRPFFQDHFARLDRQIILVDALSAFNAGPDAVRDLEGALAAVLECFRMGRRTWTSALFRPRVDRILFAATKADHLHHASHERLEAILSRMVERAAERASAAGAPVDVVALSAVRATREAKVRRGRDDLPCIIGVPAAGEVAGGEVFDGATEAAMFPGDLPADPNQVFGPLPTFRGLTTAAAQDADFRFLRLRPPQLEQLDGVAMLPHIRLDRALQFLIGDRMP
ncbi:MAG TPA: YcjX family protein [Xanthobacteraceae bacterium]|nr:YcjX family protein [Xanthobacteraceae bacterium]